MIKNTEEVKKEKQFKLNIFCSFPLVMKSYPFEDKKQSENLVLFTFSIKKLSKNEKNRDFIVKTKWKGQN